MEQSSNNSRSFLSTLSTQQLRQILLAEVESDETNVELIRNITAVLEARDYSGTDIDVEDAYKDFLSDHAMDQPLYDIDMAGEEEPTPSPERKPVRTTRLARLALVAAIIMAILLGTTVVASAAGYDLWGAITRWTADVFGFATGKEPTEIDHGQIDNAPYSELEDYFLNQGLDLNVIPKYLPEGFRLIDVTSDETYEGTIITAAYSHANNEIILSYIIGAQNTSALYPKDTDEPVVYERCGVKHYLVYNEGKWGAIWETDNIVCRINGVTEKAELLKMLDSIYERK